MNSDNNIINDGNATAIHITKKMIRTTSAHFKGDDDFMGSCLFLVIIIIVMDHIITQCSLSHRLRLESLTKIHDSLTCSAIIIRNKNFLLFVVVVVHGELCLTYISVLLGLGLRSAKNHQSSISHDNNNLEK